MKTREVHRRVKKALAEIEEEENYVCVNVGTIAERADTDVRTAKRHLDLLEEDGLGKFCDPKGKTFQSNEKLNEVISDYSQRD